jgi:multisubunit Na+/H+ antiporter MnhB subunit
MSRTPGMTLIVKTVVRLIVWLIFLYGIYIILHGHLSPGGGFGGGVVLALGLLGMLLAYGRGFIAEWLPLPVLRRVDYSSLLLFVAAGLLGLAAGGAFLLNVLAKGRLFSVFSAGLIPILNILIGIKVGLSLFFAVLALAEFDLEKGAEE